MLKKFSVLIGLTETEIKVLLFLVFTFLLGFGYKTFFQQSENGGIKKFDYSKEDSLFFSVDKITAEDKVNEPVDYKEEVLDFNETNFSTRNPKETPAEKSINLNSARLEDLILIPGIGKKTAERIIELRNKRVKFNSPEELLEVKGIGEAKFYNIRKYVFIE